ncbi:uncharacterized protein LOC116771971 [Danaus plexippus]|uniref:uncharacterized protein LOC116771971 n=1 Tax=Danaus plexippus TaxID=13037 RepID=UPI002AB16CFD|nr:uncharacterized protein LOC116771971 [Danaus plexippus]
MTENMDISILKLKLNSAKRRKLANERKEFTLRNEQQSLSEQISLLSLESESLSLQIEDLKQKIIQSKYQIAMIDICAASEKAKLENYSKVIQIRKESFDQLFANGNYKIKQHNAKNEKLRTKLAEAEEAQRKKEANILERNEMKTKEAVAIEEECVAIEKECSVLVKRNKAIMIQLRRKLVEAENIRRELIKKKENAIIDNK